MTTTFSSGFPFSDSEPAAADPGMPVRIVSAGLSMQYVSVTPVCDTSAYGAGDTLFDTTLITNATRVADGLARLDTIVVLDEDDQAAANMTLYFLDANVTLGTANAAPSISDANARNLLGYVTLASAAFLDVGGAKVACALNVNMIVKPATGTRNIYVAATTAGTPTQTASGIKLRFGFTSL
jgi:hypothetical protein